MFFISAKIKNPYTDFGIKVRARLFELNRTQNWLIQELKQKTGMYVDCSIVNKVLTGRVKSKKIITAINEILFKTE